VKKFHTTVARLLYLSRRGRPDIITAVGFLCTRVKGLMVEDYKKLVQVLGHLRQTVKHVLTLHPKKMVQVEVFIDASYATHEDGKSHSGLVVKIGGVAVLCASCKQKCVSKSPTEAALVALLDNLGFVELFQEFLSFVTNSMVTASVIFQDNTSVISMVTSGGGVTRTKHMRARMFLVLEAVRESRVIVRYIPTSLMIADGITKPLEGKAFDFFAKTVMGHDNKSTGGR
jgi:magnesium-transporting ATPase (P-type)